MAQFVFMNRRYTMSKVICDICGTNYPDTAAACPICGYTRDVSAQLLADEYEMEDASANSKTAPVRGGRFSNSNVRKRNKAAAVAYQQEPAEYDEQDYEQEPRKESNVFLIVVLVVLIIALLAVSGYIFVRYYLHHEEEEDSVIETSEQTEPKETSSETEEETVSIPCESLMLLGSDVVELTKEGQYYLLNIQAQPVNTTDTMAYSSSNEEVAIVNGEGRIEAVGEGTAVITATCGEQTLECMIVVAYEEPTEEETEEPTEEETEEPTEEETGEPTEEETQEETEEPTEEETTAPPADVVNIKLDKTDISFSSIGVTYTLTYSPSDIPAEEITWTSGNESVCIVENGVITIKGYGMTTIYAEYQGVTVECIVRVSRG